MPAAPRPHSGPPIDRHCGPTSTRAPCPTDRNDCPPAAVRVRRAPALAVALAAALQAGAPSAAPWSEGPFFGDDDHPGIIALGGEIAEDSPRDFRAALAGRPAEVLVLDSIGGSIRGALDLSLMIRDRGIATLIPPGAECLSACAFLFVAGPRRQAEGRLGVHQFSSSGFAAPADIETETQSLAAEIIDILKDYGVAPMFLVRIFETESAGMYYFQRPELEGLGLVTEARLDTALAAWRRLARRQGAGTAGGTLAPDDPGPPGATPQAEAAEVPATHPSFDCAEAEGPAEALICRDLALADLDRALARRARLTSAALGGLAGQAVLLDQSAWRFRRNRCGADPACLAEAYSRRLAELSALLAG